MSLVVHNKKDRFDVYIGRPSLFGNPFEIGTHGSRDEVIDKYKSWLLNGISFGNPEASEEKRREDQSWLRCLLYAIKCLAVGVVL
jgi:hypothetical protein